MQKALDHSASTLGISPAMCWRHTI